MPPRLPASRAAFIALAALPVVGFALAHAHAAAAYGWPLKPFRKPHAIRATFGDPRYHLGAEGALSAFHFGVDIVAHDGTPVYAVEPGVVVRRRLDSVTVGRKSGRRYGYWHIRPVVKSGTHIRLHQLLGYVGQGLGARPLRGELSRQVPRSASQRRAHAVLRPHLADRRVDAVHTPEGAPVDLQHVTGAIDVIADIYDTPQIKPPAPWDLARLAPASIWWELVDSRGVMVDSASRSTSTTHFR